MHEQPDFDQLTLLNLAGAFSIDSNITQIHDKFYW